jgi:hypothetical protein
MKKASTATLLASTTGSYHWWGAVPGLRQLVLAVLRAGPQNAPCVGPSASQGRSLLLEGKTTSLCSELLVAENTVHCVPVRCPVRPQHAPKQATAREGSTWENVVQGQVCTWCKTHQQQHPVHATNPMTTHHTARNPTSQNTRHHRHNQTPPRHHAPHTTVTHTHCHVCAVPLTPCWRQRRSGCCCGRPRCHRRRRSRYASWALRPRR